MLATSLIVGVLGVVSSVSCGSWLLSRLYLPLSPLKLIMDFGEVSLLYNEES